MLVFGNQRRRSRSRSSLRRPPRSRSSRPEKIFKLQCYIDTKFTIGEITFVLLKVDICKSKQMCTVVSAATPPNLIVLLQPIECLQTNVCDFNFLINIGFLGNKWGETDVRIKPSNNDYRTCVHNLHDFQCWFNVWFLKFCCC